MAGKTITIINRSEIVGRPLAAMLANDGATIYSVDVDSIFTFRRGALRKTEASPEDAVGQSDVVITVSSNTQKKAFAFYVPGICLAVWLLTLIRRCLQWRSSGLARLFSVALLLLVCMVFCFER